ncbi:hypothetical protein [Aurantiacibacter rhizosphaerae]|uniref:TonB C-terminal domain-containing protein n=1 Tax=Aurantiacibacter rhizosphaerae TaxID=2691582 RepID=A0A844X9B5_9SPHN|nr:hypothetical protein [Aurantiacibacter rhizosphaerae]MWV26274.1 hypothetical protein [Aurantiacibacter rhizosphaerae]
MYQRTVLPVFAVLTAVFAIPVAAQEDLHPINPEAQELIDSGAIHMPDGLWSLSEAVDGCSLQRNFLLDDNRVTLAMKRLQGGYPIEFALVGGEFEPDEPLQAGFQPGRNGLEEHRFIGAASAGDRKGVFFSAQPFPRGGFAAPAQSVLAPDTQYFIAQNDEGYAVVLRTGRIDLALDALEQCGERQLASLGVDLNRPNGISRSAVLLNADEFSDQFSRAYGRVIQQQRRNVESDLHIRLVIDGDGTLAHCHAGDGLTPRALREAVCDMVRKNGEFRTALDNNGQPIADTWSTRVAFRIMMDQPGADGTIHRARD